MDSSYCRRRPCAAAASAARQPGLPPIAAACSHKRSCRSGASRTALRCRAQSEGRPHGSADEAALQTLMMKLREDDVEYFELKVGLHGWLLIALPLNMVCV